MQRLSGQRTEEQIAAPVRKQRPGIKHGARRRDGGIPVIDRLLHASLVRADADLTAVVVASVADNRPAIVFASLGDVDFIAAPSAKLEGAQISTRGCERP